MARSSRWRVASCVSPDGWERSLAKAVLLAAVALGCAACTTPRAAPRIPKGAPIVVIAGEVDCLGVPDSDVGAALQLDADRLWHTLSTEPTVVLGTEFTSERENVEEAVSNSGSAHGLTVFYSGHGSDGRGGPRAAHLCLGPGEAATSVGELIDRAGSASPARPSWTVFLLNSCYSAHVDVSNEDITASVLTVAHETVSAFRANRRATEGTLVGQALVRVLRDEGKRGPLDRNCDGLVTDQELIDALEVELHGDAEVQAVVVPPKLNLRRNGPTQIPLAFPPLSHSECDPELRRKQIGATLSALQGGSAEHVRDLVNQQMGLAKELALRVPERRGALPHTDRDFFVVQQPSNPNVVTKVRKLATEAHLLEFPGKVEEAEIVAEYSISFEVYRIEPRLGGKWMRIVRLRDGALMHSGMVERSAAALASLGDRLEIVPTSYDATATVVRFWGEVPARARKFPAIGDFSFDPARARAVPCEEEAGQCFVQEP